MPPRSHALPPRAALPRDVEIPVLPNLGDTWYDHGLPYWARRVGMTLLWVLVLALLGALDFGIFSGIRQSSRTGFAVFLAVDVALTVALLVWAAVRTVQQWNTAALPGQAPGLFPARKGPARDGTARNGPDRNGPDRKGTAFRRFAPLFYWPLVLVMAVAFLFFPGIFILMFLTSLMPQTPTERHARLWMAEQLRERGHYQPTT